MDPRNEQDEFGHGSAAEERQGTAPAEANPDATTSTAQRGPGQDGQQSPAGQQGDPGGRPSSDAAYGEATRDKVRGSDYRGGKGIVGAAPPGAGYDQTKRAVQPPRPQQAALPTVPAASVQDKIIDLLSYGWTDIVVTDADATEAFRLLSIANDKARVFAAMRDAGVYERLWENLPRAAITANFQRTLSVYKALPEAEKLNRMSELLSIGLTDWAVDERELWLVIEVLDTMSPAGRATFVQKDGGVWYGKLMGAQIPDAPPPNQAAETEDKSWVEMAGDAIAAGGEFVRDVAADPGGALREIKRGGTFAVNLIVDGEVDLEYAQEMAGGSLGGITLDECAENQVDLDLNTDEGHADVAIAQLGIAAIETQAGGMAIRTGGGSIRGVHGQLKWSTAKDSASGVRLEIQSLALTNLQLTSDMLELVLPMLALQAVRVAVEKPLAQQATPTSPAEAAILAGQELVLMVDDWLPAMSALGTAPGQDPETLSQRVAESFGGAMNYELSLGAAVLSGLRYSERGDDGEMRQVAAVGEAKISGISAKLEHGDSLVVLGQERDTLRDKAKTGRLGAAEADRLAFLDAELQALQAVQARATELQAKDKAGGLSQEERDELTTANNRLRTGVVHVQAQVVEVRDATYEGDHVDHATVQGVSARAASAELGFNEQTSGEQAASEAKALRNDADALDSVLDRSLRGADVARSNDRARATERAAESKADADAKAKARAEAGLPEPSVAEGIGANVRVDNAAVAGANVRGVAVDAASVTNLDARAAEDASELHLGAADLRGLQGSHAGAAGTLQSGHLGNVSLHQNASDVGGYVGEAKVDGLHGTLDDKTIDLGSAGVQGVRADVDLAGQRARSASIDALAVDAARLRDGDRTTEAASLDASGLRGTGISDKGAASADLGHLAVEGARFTDGTTNASVGSLQVDALRGQGLTRDGAAGVQIGGVAVRDGALRNDDVSLRTDSLAIHDASGTGIHSHGAASAAFGSVRATNTDFAEDGVTVHADGLQLDGVAGKNLAAGGHGDVTVDALGAQGLRGGKGSDHGSVDSLAVQDIHANVDDRGTVAGFGGAQLGGIRGSTGTGAAKKTASVDALKLGDSAVALDDDHVLQGARVDGLNASHIRAHLLLNASAAQGGSAAAPTASTGGAQSAAAAATGGGSAPREQIHADALASASGTFRAHVPVDWKPLSWLGGYVGTIDISAKAKNGRIDLEDLHISGEGLSGFAGRVGSSMLKIVKGRGLVAQFLLFRFTLMDAADFGGLQSEREGGSRKGSILLEKFAESVLNPKVELTDEAHAAVEDARRRHGSDEEPRTAGGTRRNRHGRGNRRNTRRNRREEAPPSDVGALEQAEKYVDVGRTQVDISGLKLGSGLVGTASAHATLTNDSAQANRFELHTTLGKSATASAQRIAAKDLHATDPDGRPIDAGRLGIDGLQVDVLRPLSENADVTVVVDGMQVTAIRVGDQSRLR